MSLEVLAVIGSEQVVKQPIAEILKKETTAVEIVPLGAEATNQHEEAHCINATTRDAIQMLLLQTQEQAEDSSPRAFLLPSQAQVLPTEYCVEAFNDVPVELCMSSELSSEQRQSHQDALQETYHELSRQCTRCILCPATGTKSAMCFHYLRKHVIDSVRFSSVDSVLPYEERNTPLDSQYKGVPQRVFIYPWEGGKLLKETVNGVNVVCTSSRLFDSMVNARSKDRGRRIRSIRMARGADQTITGAETTTSSVATIHPGSASVQQPLTHSSVDVLFTYSHDPYNYKCYKLHMQAQVPYDDETAGHLFTAYPEAAHRSFSENGTDHVVGRNLSIATRDEVEPVGVVTDNESAITVWCHNPYDYTYTRAYTRANRPTYEQNCF